MAKSSKKGRKTVSNAIRRQKRGKLKKGKGGTSKVKSKKQAIAIGLSEARKKGQKVPPRKKSRGGKKKKKTKRTKKK